MRGVAETGDHSHRFESAQAGIEIRVLSETYNHLMESLQRHEETILQRAREDLDAFEKGRRPRSSRARTHAQRGGARDQQPAHRRRRHIEMLLEVEAISEPVRKRLATVRAEGRRIVALVQEPPPGGVAPRHGRAVDRDVNRIMRDTVALRQRDFSRRRGSASRSTSPRSR